MDQESNRIGTGQEEGEFCEGVVQEQNKSDTSFGVFKPRHMMDGEV